jgi:AraC-like DNA-binding protein
LNLLAGQKSKQLQEQLLNADTVERRISLLDNYISGLIAVSKNICPMIEYAANRISRNPSKSILGLVQKELFTTERTFQRLFEKNIGIAPGIYRRVCQFNNAFQKLNNRNFNSLTDIAFENGYADQSHYIRSFKEFTNLTPKDYLNLGSRPQSK